MGQKNRVDRNIRVYTPTGVKPSKTVYIACEGCGKSVQLGVKKLRHCTGYKCGKLSCLENSDFILPTVRHPHFYQVFERAAGKLYGYSLARRTGADSVTPSRIRANRTASVDRWGLERHHKKVLRNMFRGDRLLVVKGVGYALGTVPVQKRFVDELISSELLKTSDGVQYFMTEKGREIAQISFFAKARDPREWIAKKDHPEFNKRLAEAVTRLRDKGIELTEVVIIEVAQQVLSSMRTDGFHHRKIDADARPPHELKNQYRRGDILRKNSSRAKHYG